MISPIVFQKTLNRGGKKNAIGNLYKIWIVLWPQVLYKNLYKIIFLVYSESDRLYLTERGLELWLAVAQNSSRMTPQLLGLFQRCIYCMMTIPDMLQYCINLFKSYLLLGGAQFVSEYQAPVTINLSFFFCVCV